MLALLVLLAVAHISADVATATFTLAPVTGSVAINDKGTFSIGLSYTVDAVNTLISNCISANAGFVYHIHDKWAPPTNGSSKLQGDCALAYMGNHYDPTIKCSSASGNPYCNVSGLGTTCSGLPVISSYGCSINNPVACEVGDLSSKVGRYPTGGEEVGTTLSYDDPSLPPAAAIAGKSVVLHCNGVTTSARFACARLIVTPQSATTRTVYKSNSNFASVEAKGNGGKITYDGKSWNLDVNVPTTINGAPQATCVGSGMSYHIHDKWTPTTATSTYEEGAAACTTATGLHFDPDFGCANKTNNNACMQKGGCVQPSQSVNGLTYAPYFCNSSDPYSCEKGDLSGQFGKVTPVNNKITYNSATNVNAVIWRTLNVRMDDINNKGITFHCADGTMAFCFKLSGVLAPPTPPPSGGAAGLAVSFIVLLSLLFTL